MPFVPPTGLPTPDVANQAVILDTKVIQTVDSTLGNYSILEPGSVYPMSTLSVADYAKYSGFLLMGQAATEDPTKVARVFAPLPYTQDVDNYDIEYSGQNDSSPIFIRRYIELRDTYTKRAEGSLFTGLYAIKVTASGTGYAAAPTVSFTGGTGTGATAVAILNSTGGVARIILKAEGTSYNGSESVVLTGGGGTAAAASVIVQGSTCFLVEEKTQAKAPEPYGSLCMLVSRTYETLPGPWLYNTQIAPDGNVVTAQKRHNKKTSITPAEALGGGTYSKTTTEPITDFVSWEILETRAISGNTLTGKEDTEWGPATTLSTLNATATALTITNSTLSASSTPVSSVTNQLKTMAIDALPSTPYLYAETIDHTTRIKVRVRKRLVANGTAGGITKPATVNITLASVATATELTLSGAIPSVDVNWPFKTGDWVTIANDTNATPSINGNWPAAVIDSTHITIPVTVASVAGSGFGTVNLAPELFTEIQSSTDRQAIELGSQVDSSTLAGAEKIFSQYVNYPWPEVLVAIDSFNDLATDSTAASGTFALPTQLSWAWSATFTGAVGIRTKRYTGQTLEQTDISYSIGPPVIDAVQEILLQSGEIVITGGGFHKSLAQSWGTGPTLGIETSVGTSVRYSTVRIENVLTSSFVNSTLAAGSALRAEIELKLNASTPTTFAANATFISSSSVSDGLLGLYRKEKRTVTVPAGF
jgi:hypothetical protein